VSGTSQPAFGKARLRWMATLGLRSLAAFALVWAYFMFWEPVRHDLTTLVGQTAAELAGTEFAIQPPATALKVPGSVPESQQAAIDAFFGSEQGILVMDAGAALAIRAPEIDPNKRFSFTGFVRKQVPLYLAILILIGASLKEGILLVVFYIVTTFMSLGMLWGALIYSPYLLYAMDFTVVYLTRFLPLMWLLIRLKQALDDWRAG
jgi:hypothetical protein